MATLLISLGAPCKADDVEPADAFVSHIGADPAPRPPGMIAAEIGAAPPSANALAPLLADGHLNMFLRNYAETIQIEHTGTRHAWLQSAQLNFESGYTDGWLGFGLDVSSFLTIKLDGGQGARNMAHYNPDGTGQGQDAWAGIGKYALKASLPGATIKAGLLSLDNPYLSPYDTRSLPPTFRGISLIITPMPGLKFDAGSVDAVMARGSTRLQPLTTSYGGVAMRRHSYAGAEYAHTGTALSLYVSRADDLWNQYYASASHAAGAAADILWTGGGALYVTRPRGTRLQDDVRNTAYSVALTARHASSSLMLGYQRVIGETFFDFVQETDGIHLANSMAVDYNAPNEQSLQLRYKFDGNADAMPGYQATLWYIGSRGVHAPGAAARYAPPASLLHGIYWRNDAPIGGGNSEFGTKASYTFQRSEFKGATVIFRMMLHASDDNYPSKRFRDYKLTVDIPLKLF